MTKSPARIVRDIVTNHSAAHLQRAGRNETPLVQFVDLSHGRTFR